MARIELRDSVLTVIDGFAGTAKVGATGTSGAVSLAVGTVAGNLSSTDRIPVGARFTIAGESTLPIHVVTARTPAGATGPTTAVTITPALVSTCLPDAVITLLPQRLEIKLGDGSLSYTEHNEYEYLKDRGVLDTVREKDDVPMDVKLECVYESITTGTSETVSPMDALKGIGEADEWVSSSSDKCEPYCVDLEILHSPPCGSKQDETTLFPDFRSDSREINFKDATINVSGKCNATEPIVSRS